MKGIFISFEGPEGSGKSTQSRLLCGFLRREGYPVLHLREPGGTHIGELIRQILLNSRNRKMSGVCEALLFLASRAQVVEEKILPALKKGYIVICDRFQDATLAYQGYGEGIDLSILEMTGRWTTGGLIPDLTFLLDIDTKGGFKRTKVKDRIEKKGLSFHRRVRRGYLKLAQKNPRRIFLIKTDKDVDKIQNLIRKKTLEFLKHARNHRAR